MDRTKSLQVQLNYKLVNLASFIFSHVTNIKFLVSNAHKNNLNSIENKNL